MAHIFLSYVLVGLLDFVHQFMAIFFMVTEYNLTVSHRLFSNEYTTLSAQNGQYLAISTEQFYVILL